MGQHDITAPHCAQVWDTALFPRWQNLTTLVLSGCGLAVLPTMVGRLTGLRELWCSHNRIATLPRELGALRRLHTLKADDNLLTALPGAQAVMCFILSL